MRYRPEYVKGQILVVFKNNCSEDFVRDFGKILGYDLSDETYKHGDAYIFKTKAGKEKKAIKKFEAYSKFVDLADLRDIKIESRWDNLELIIAKIKELHDNVELPDKLYNQKLKDIGDCLTQFLME